MERTPCPALPVSGSGLPRGGGQPRSGVKAQHESVDGGELLAFSQVREKTVGQGIHDILKILRVLPLMDLVQLGLDVDVVEPAHEVGHNITFQSNDRFVVF